MITALPRVAIAVRDFDAAVTMFQDVFGMPVVDFSSWTVPDLGAHVGMCVPEGGSNIELMASSDPAAPLSRSLDGFIDRRGEGLFALMLEAPDPNGEAAELAERGLDVLPLMPGATGRDLHPRSTSGVLIRVYPDGSVADQGPQEKRGPGFTGIQTTTIAVNDLDAAAASYGKGIGLAVEPMEQDTERGVAVVRCRAPKGGSIDLVAVHDSSRPFAADVEKFLTDVGPGLYSLTLGAQDPAQASAHLLENGIDLDDGIFGTRMFVQ